MAQQDYTIPNQARALFRANLNNVLDAVQSSNSGATAPTDTAPFMVWADTSTSPPTLRIRNAGDTAWLVIGALGETFTPSQALLAAVAALDTNGLMARTGTGTAASRTITGTANQITVTNGNGVSGNPTIAPVIATQAEAEAGTDNAKLMTALRAKQAIDVAVAALPEPVVDGVDLRNRVQAEVFADSGSWATITGLAAVKAATFVLSATSHDGATDRTIDVALSTDNGSSWTSISSVSRFRVSGSVEIGATAFVELDEGIVALTGGQFGASTSAAQRAKYTAATYNAVRFRVGGSSAAGNSIRVIPIIEQGRAL